MKIHFVNPIAFTIPGKQGWIWNYTGRETILGYYQDNTLTSHLRRLQHIVIVKQRNKWLQFSTLLHEYCHYLVDVLLENKTKFHKLVDKILR